LVTKLKEKGVGNGFALVGGTKAWKDAGYPMGKSDENKDADYPMGKTEEKPIPKSEGKPK
jgi:hypothetical protein